MNVLVAGCSASVTRGWSAWCRFWFDADGRTQVRAFRMGFGLLLFSCYLLRSLDLDLYYGPNGIMPLSILPDLAPMEFRWSIFRVFTGETALWVGNGMFLASLLAFALGFYPRFTVWVVWALHLSFVHRNLAIDYGVDIISCYFLFYLCFADYRSDRTFKRGDLRATLGSMAYRLCQIQVCVIYGYSGLKKLKGPSWWLGEAIWNGLADPQIARWDFSWLAKPPFPLMLAGVTYLTLAWEVYFPALVWIRPIRKPVLVIGVMLHLGIALFLNLPFFAILMVLTYLLFLDASVLKRVITRIPQVPGRASE